MLAHGKDKFYDAELGVYKKTGNKSSEGAMETEERIFKSKVYLRVILYFLLLTPSLQNSIIKSSDTADVHTFFEDESHVYFDLDRCRIHQHIMQCGSKIIDTLASPTPFFFPDTLSPSAMPSYGPNGIQTEHRIVCRNRGTKRSREQVPVIRFNSNGMCFIPPPDFYAAVSRYLYSEPELSLNIPPNPTRNDNL